MKSDYVGIHLNAKKTCANDNNNRISGQQTDNKLACQKICDEDERCKFFYLNTEGYCAIYKKCKKKETQIWDQHTRKPLRMVIMKQIIL